MEISQYEIFSRLLLLPPSHVQALGIGSSASRGRRPCYSVGAACLILSTYLHLVQRLITSAANTSLVAAGRDTSHLKESAGDHVT
jgi:hypothetical protein